MGPLVELTLDNGHYISVTGDSSNRSSNRPLRLHISSHKYGTIVDISQAQFGNILPYRPEIRRQSRLSPENSG